MFRKVPLSIIRSLFTVHWAMVYIIQVCRQLSSRTRMELQFHPGPARKLSETCRVSCQNKFVKLVHLVGFITEKSEKVPFAEYNMTHFLCSSSQKHPLQCWLLFFSHLSPSDHYMYRQFNIQQFCVLLRQTAFICFVWIWETKTTIISLYSINWLVFIAEMESVYCAVWTGHLTFSNSTFCPHSVFMCFVWIWEQTATCATYSINWLVFIIEMKSVYSAVRTGALNKAVCALYLKG